MEVEIMVDEVALDEEILGILEMETPEMLETDELHEAQMEGIMEIPLLHHQILLHQQHQEEHDEDEADMLHSPQKKTIQKKKSFLLKHINQKRVYQTPQSMIFQGKKIDRKIPQLISIFQRISLREIL